MKKFSAYMVLTVLLGLGSAYGNESHEIFNRAPGFTVPDGAIAYLGSYYNPTLIWDQGNSKKYLRSAMGTQNPPAAAAVSEFQAAFVKQAAQLKIDAAPVSVSDEDRLSIIKHALHPDKFSLKPGFLAKLCGDKPYALVGLIDYYGTFACEVRIRETSDKDPKEKIDYFRMRSILERENHSRYRKVGAEELFLLSAKDGSLLWHANGVEHIEHIIFNSFWDTAVRLMEHQLKDLEQVK